MLRVKRGSTLLLIVAAVPVVGILVHVLRGAEVATLPALLHQSAVGIGNGRGTGGLDRLGRCFLKANAAFSLRCFIFGFSASTIVTEERPCKHAPTRLGAWRMSPHSSHSWDLAYEARYREYSPTAEKKITAQTQSRALRTTLPEKLIDCVDSTSPTACINTQ